MAKRKTWAAAPKATESVAKPEAAPPVATVPKVPTPKATSRKRYRVSLASQTPLANDTLEVEAETETEARCAFNKANHIRGSVHQYTVVEI